MKAVYKWLLSMFAVLGCVAISGTNTATALAQTMQQPTEKTVMAANADDARTDAFAYEEGIEYYGEAAYLNRTFSSNYKGHTAVPLNSHTKFFMEHEVQHEYLTGEALVSASNTVKGSLMVLNFVHPIDADEFNRLNLRVYINHQIDVLTYNADAITEDSLGAALEAFTVNGGEFTYLTLNSALYVNDDNKVETIVFKFAEDCQPQYRDGEMLYDTNGQIIRDTFFFVSFNVEQEENVALVSKDSFMVVDSEDTYDVTFRFNKIGPIENDVLDTSKVLLNGVTLKQLLSECQDATAEWYPAKGIYQINVSIPKSYVGKAQIKNAQYGFAGNNMTVSAGLTFPNGETLNKSYTCHLYAGENLLDSEMVENYAETVVERVEFEVIEDSGNLNFSIYFSQPITASLYNHACEREDWRSQDSVKDIISYDEASADIFISGGYKSALLDNVLINGLTIGEWHAYDARTLTNIQVHYGVALEMNRMDIRFESHATGTYNRLYDFVEAESGITVEVLSGLKFTTNYKTMKDQVFEMNAGKFTEVLDEQAVHVYFDGSEIVNGQDIVVQTAVSDASIAVEGAKNYTVSHEMQDGKKVYTIVYNDGEIFTFTVTEDIVQPTVAPTTEGGCGSYAGFSAVAVLGVTAAVIAMAKRRENYDKN